MASRVTEAGLVLGLNDVTKRCVHSELSVILVCKEDIVPSLLVEHFPMIAFHHQSLLVPLPKGASQRLQEEVFLKVKKVSVLGIKKEAPELSNLVAFLCQKLKSHANANNVHYPATLLNAVPYLPLATLSK